VYGIMNTTNHLIVIYNTVITKSRRRRIQQRALLFKAKNASREHPELKPANEIFQFSTIQGRSIEKGGSQKKGLGENTHSGCFLIKTFA